MTPQIVIDPPIAGPLPAPHRDAAPDRPADEWVDVGGPDVSPADVPTVVLSGEEIAELQAEWAREWRDHGGEGG